MELKRTIYLPNTNSEKPYSLKPPQYHVPKDISPNEIFKTMRLKNQSNASEQRKEIIKNYRDYTLQNKFPPTVLFHAIYLFDILLIKSQKLSQREIFDLSVGAFILSAKFNCIGAGPAVELRPWSKVNEKNNIVYTRSSLILLELKCLKMWNYVLTLDSAYNYIQIFLINGITFNTDLVNDNSKNNKWSVNSGIYSKPYIIYEYILDNSGLRYWEYNNFHLACAWVALSRELNDLISWNDLLEKVFGVKWNTFVNEITFVKESYCQSYMKTWAEKKRKILDNCKRNENYRNRSLNINLAEWSLFNIHLNGINTKKNEGSSINFWTKIAGRYDTNINTNDSKISTIDNSFRNKEEKSIAEMNKRKIGMLFKRNDNSWNTMNTTMNWANKAEKILVKSNSHFFNIPKPNEATTAKNRMTNERNFCVSYNNINPTKSTNTKYLIQSLVRPKHK